MRLTQHIKEMATYQKDIDATQIAEIVWLSQFMGKSTDKQKSKDVELDKDDPLTSHSESKNDLPRDVEHTIVLNAPPKINQETTHSFEKGRHDSSTFSVTIESEQHLPDITKQFHALKIKTKTISQTELNEEKVSPKLTPPNFVLRANLRGF